ncbi:MAG: hypothetical protein IJK46_05855 [Prevotella sp.]|nr:hypothetical protein [Prevotella sp.]
MAKNIDEFITKVTLNAEEAKKQLDAMSKKVEEFRKLRDDAAKNGNGEMAANYAKEIAVLEKQMRSYKAASQNVVHTLDNLSGATLAELKKAQKELNKEMQNVPRNTEYYKDLKDTLEKVKAEIRGVKEEAAAANGGQSKLGAFLQNTFANYSALVIHDIQDVAMEFIRSIKGMVVESTELAKTAEGIEAAFDRINKPGLLDELRKATHGTVTDIELMKQAVKFKDFNLPIDQLGKYLAYAQQKAKDTGESIDYLVNSIVTGLGRQSPQILDNLGLSAKEISEEAKKSGDFFGAVAAIIDKQMAAAGEHMETSMDRAAQAATRLKNTQLEVGKSLLPLKENADAVFTEMKIGALQAVKWLYENRQAILEVATSVAALTLAYKSLYIWQKTVAAYHTTMTALQNGLTAATGLLRSAVLALKIAYANTTTTTIAFRRAIVAARAAAVVNPWVALITVLTGVGVAVYAAVKAWDAHKKAIIENTVAFKTAKAVKEDFANVQKQASSATLQEKTRISELTRIIRDNSKTVDERRNAIAALQKIVPGYHATLTSEGVLHEQNATAIEKHINKLNDLAMAQALYDKMRKIQGDKFDAWQKLQRKKNNVRAVNAEIARRPEVYNATEEVVYGDNGERFVLSRYQKAGRQKRIELQIQRKAEENAQKEYDIQVGREKEINKYLQQHKDVGTAYTNILTGGTPTPQVTPTPTATPKGGGGGSSSVNTGDTKYEEEFKQLEAAHKRRNTLLKEQFAYQVITEKEYQQQMLASDMTYYKDKIALQQQYGQDTTDAQNSMLDLIISETNRRNREEEAAQKEHLAKQKEAEKQAENDRKKFFDQMRGAYEKSIKLTDNPNEQLQLLQAMLDQGLLSYEDYQQRKTEVEQEAESRRQEIREMFMQQATQLMGDLSSLYSAMQQQEINAVEAKYQKQIAAAQKAGKDTTKLEKKRQKEINAIKKKYAEKEFQMKVFQIIADTAVGIARLWASPGYPMAIPLTALVAASGAIQLATAKKAQEQAASEGYYEGGFTGGKRYRKEAGVVHEGEFVANHQAVQNPAILPFLNFLDQAQRNNTVGSLTAQDVSRSMGAVGSVPQTIVSAPTVNVQTDNSELRDSIDRLNARLDEGIPAYSIIDGEQGTYRKIKQYERLIGKRS